MRMVYDIHSHHITALALFGLILSVPTSAAHAETLEIWVAPGLYGTSESNCNPESGIGRVEVRTQIDVQLCGAFNKSGIADFSRHFQTEMASSNFSPYLVEKPGAKLPPSTVKEQRLRSTLVASLHISRADIWEVDKFNGSHEVFLPNTVSLIITNVRTGEVVFTQTNSLIPNGLALSSQISHYAEQNVSEKIKENISQLVKIAASRFHPYPISATVQGAFQDYFVIDKGKSSGVRAGDWFQPDVKVTYSDADYAIVQPAMKGDIKVGSVLQMQNVQPAEYLSKQTALVVMGATPEKMSPAYLKQTFEEKLGSTSLFNITTINPSLRDIRTSAATAAEASPNDERLPIPDYFVYVQSFGTEGTATPSNIPNIIIKTFEAYSVGEIIDRAGRVLYARVASDRIVDQVAAGIGLPDAQRQETVLRNSLEKLAGFMKAEFKPSSSRLAINRLGSANVVLDAGGMLSDGANGTILRKVGTFGAIKSPVWAPFGGPMRVKYDNGTAYLQGDGLDGSPSKGDLFSVEGGGTKLTQSRRAFGLCAIPQGLRDGDLSGSPLIRAIGLANFASASAVPVYIDELPGIISFQLRTFAKHDSLGIANSRQIEVCSKPIFRFAPLGPAKVSSDMRASKYSLSVGYTFHDPTGLKLSANGIQLELTMSAVPVKTPDEEIKKGELREFYSQMNKISPNVISKIIIP